MGAAVLGVEVAWGASEAGEGGREVVEARRASAGGVGWWEGAWGGWGWAGWGGGGPARPVWWEVRTVSVVGGSGGVDRGGWRGVW